MVPVGPIATLPAIIAVRAAISAIIPVIIATIVIAARVSTAIIITTVVIAGIAFILAISRTAWTAIVVIAALALGIARLTFILVIAPTLLTADITACGSGFILTELVVVYNAKVMVGVLQEVFCLHAVSIMLRILGQLLILVE